MKKTYLHFVLMAVLSLQLFILSSSSCNAATDFPIVFTTQVPIPADFTTIGSTFGNHLAELQTVGRGGDLWIRYTDGSLKNLTLAAGYGNEGFQGTNSIAVRDPAVSWDGKRVVFSMALHSTLKQYQWESYFWQLYEITGLEKNATPVIIKVALQPAKYNNISPVYDSDGRIIFASDRPRKGMAHLYPQLDEYESSPTVSGLWNLDPQSGKLFMVTHSPSGDFTPIIDSYGRVIFSRWDHLQRDQQADNDHINGGTSTFNWSDESVSAIPLNERSEVFPEPRSERSDLLQNSNLRGHEFNHFFPWMVNEDGSELETLNHIGRHELHSYFDRSMNGDQNLNEFIATVSGRINQNSINNFFQIQEDPLRPGHYIGVDAPEFGSHAAGQIIEIKMPPGMNPDLAQIVYRTSRATEIITDTPTTDHSGHYRDPLALSNGQIIAAHTTVTGAAANMGSRANPIAKYDFRLKFLTESNGVLIPGSPLSNGIKKTVSYWDPDVLVTYSGALWELHPVELRPRNRSEPLGKSLETPEINAFIEAGVNLEQFKQWLKANDLALLVSRNVTSRDISDTQQPYNLKIEGSSTQTIGSSGAVYDISHLQFFQGDLIRGMGGVDTTDSGKRVLAQAMHDAINQNPSNPAGPVGSVKLGADGSMAVIVPAERALSWQLTDAKGTGIVRERNWLSFASGEIRVCASCHGINTTNQAGFIAPINTPKALVGLLRFWAEKNTSVDAACAETDTQVNLSIKCVAVKGINYYAKIDRYIPPIKTERLLWKFSNAGKSDSQSAMCATTDTRLNIHIPCVLYKNRQYEADLNRYTNPLDTGGLYWELNQAKPK